MDFPKSASSFATAARRAANLRPSFAWFSGGSLTHGRKNPGEFVSKFAPKCCTFRLPPNCVSTKNFRHLLPRHESRESLRHRARGLSTAGDDRPEQLAEGYAWCYRRLFSHRTIWRRRPADPSAVLPYLGDGLSLQAIELALAAAHPASAHGGRVAALVELVAPEASAVSTAIGGAGKQTAGGDRDGGVLGAVDPQAKAERATPPDCHNAFFLPAA